MNLLQNIAAAIQSFPVSWPMLACVMIAVVTSLLILTAARTNGTPKAGAMLLGAQYGVSIVFGAAIACLVWWWFGLDPILWFYQAAIPCAAGLGFWIVYAGIHAERGTDQHG